MFKIRGDMLHHAQPLRTRREDEMIVWKEIVITTLPEYKPEAHREAVGAAKYILPDKNGCHTIQSVLPRL